MSSGPESILSHVSLGTDDLERASAFYDSVLATLGCRRIMEHDGAVCWGKAYPEFWIQRPFDEGEAQSANGVHVAFMAASKEEVRSFYEAGIAAGATDDGAPGPRPHYGEPYYGCFLYDPDGHKVEATYWDMDLARELGMG